MASKISFEEAKLTMKAARERILYTTDGLLVTPNMFKEIYMEHNGVMDLNDYNVKMVEPLTDYIKNDGLTKDQFIIEIDDDDDDYELTIEDLLKVEQALTNVSTSELITMLDMKELLLDEADLAKFREDVINIRLDTLLEDLDNELEEMDCTLEWVEKEWTPDLDEEDMDIIFEDMMIALFDITETLENALDQIKLITA